MESRNLWLVPALQVLLKDQTIKALYREKTRKHVLEHRVNRIFDEFNFLLSQVALEQQSNEFMFLLKEIKQPLNAEGEPQNLTDRCRKLADNIINKIIEKGITELLEDSGQINQELVKLLDWQDLLDNIKQVDLLCAYAGGIFQCLCKKIPKSIEEYSAAFCCASHYVNKNYGKMVVKALISRGYLADEEKNIMLEMQDFFESPVGKATFVATITTLGAALLGFGMYALSSWARNNPKLEDKEQSNDEKLNPLVRK